MIIEQRMTKIEFDYKEFAKMSEDLREFLFEVIAGACPFTEQDIIEDLMMKARSIDQWKGKTIYELLTDLTMVINKLHGCHKFAAASEVAGLVEVVERI